MTETKLTFQQELNKLSNLPLQTETVAAIGKVQPELTAYIDLALELVTQVEQGNIVKNLLCEPSRP